MTPSHRQAGKTKNPSSLIQETKDECSAVPLLIVRSNGPLCRLLSQPLPDNGGNPTEPTPQAGFSRLLKGDFDLREYRLSPTGGSLKTSDRSTAPHRRISNIAYIIIDNRAFVKRFPPFFNGERGCFSPPDTSLVHRCPPHGNGTATPPERHPPPPRSTPRRNAPYHRHRPRR